MIKIDLGADEPTSITFEQTVINMLDRLLSTPEIQQIGIKNRAALVASITIYQEEAFARLNADLCRLLIEYYSRIADSVITAPLMTQAGIYRQPFWIVPSLGRGCIMGDAQG